MVCIKMFGYYPQKVKIENSLYNFLPIQKGGFQGIACPKDRQDESWLSSWTRSCLDIDLTWHTF